MSENFNNPMFNDYLGYGTDRSALKKALKIGEEYHNNSDYGNAIKHFDYIIINDLTSEFLFAYIFKALSYFGMKEYKSSISVCSSGIKIAEKKYENDEEVDKELAILYEVRSRSYIELEDKYNAKKDLQKSIEYFPTDSHGRLANLLFEEKNYSEAVKYYQNMAMMFPDNGRNRFLMGCCYMLMNNKEEAKKQFALSNNQGYEKAYEYLMKLTYG